jgi:hypothetical protein
MTTLDKQMETTQNVLNSKLSQAKEAVQDMRKAAQAAP